MIATIYAAVLSWTSVHLQRAWSGAHGEDDPNLAMRLTRTLLETLLGALGAVTAFWWFVP
jgi:hypothetical protein